MGLTLKQKIEITQGLVGQSVDGVYGNDTADAVLKKLGYIAPASPLVPPSTAKPVELITLNAKMACELADHESIVLEAYKDSKGIWTWGIGVTDRSGHGVLRYKDNPQTVERVIEIYLWLLAEKYIPDVVRAFAGYKLTPEQFTAAVSFHYNTGAIGKATWVKLWKAGKIAEAKASFMTWTKDKELIGRRTKECNLFFDGRWTTDGLINVIPVRKPAYTPNFGKQYLVDCMPAFVKLLGQ